ncbi:MAG: folate family ECF transporter S component [Lactobacillus sp.]|nr:folate family ECF transporter S component [Lactobacillus sp.]
MTNLTWRSPKLNTRTITLAAMLIALQTVLSKLSFGSDSMVKIGIGFIGTTLIGYYLGPWLGGISLVLADLIKSTIFATGSTFFIGYTFSAFISGVIVGAFLYQQKITWQRLAIYQFVQILVSNIFFNTLWIYLMYHTPVWALLSVRVPKNVIMWPIEAIISFMILRAVSRFDARIKH